MIKNELISIRLPKETKEKFMTWLTRENKTMSLVLLEFIERYIEEREEEAKRQRKEKFQYKTGIE